VAAGEGYLIFRLNPSRSSCGYHLNRINSLRMLLMAVKP
jgi:hypothetical protein